MHKARVLRKKTFLDFKKWIKSIQTAGYNGARAVHRTIANQLTFYAYGNYKNQGNI